MILSNKLIKDNDKLVTVTSSLFCMLFGDVKLFSVEWDDGNITVTELVEKFEVFVVEDGWFVTLLAALSNIVRSFASQKNTFYNKYWI